MDWQKRLAGLMEGIHLKDPRTAINEIVDLSADVDEREAADFFRNSSSADDFARKARQVYANYILAMENTALGGILTRAIASGTQFSEVADPDARMAFERVADIFDRLTLYPDTRFVMIGCGQLPVTAIHVIERAGCSHVVCMDVIERAVAAAEQLKLAFGWGALHPVLCNGADYDFRDADVIYIANMVSPKAAVLEQVARTAPRSSQLVVREPYGLGQLWADLGEASLPDCLAVESYGDGSRYLSRDVFLSWRS